MVSRPALVPVYWKEKLPLSSTGGVWSGIAFAPEKLRETQMPLRLCPSVPRPLTVPDSFRGVPVYELAESCAKVTALMTYW